MGKSVSLARDFPLAHIPAMKPWALQLSLVLSSLFISLSLVEGVTRIVDPLHPKPVVSDRPQVRNEFTKLNKFRDLPHSLEKPDGVFRVVVLGDSFTYAGKVYFEDSYAARLQRLLDHQVYGSHKYEVIKLAYPGYTTLDELITLKNRGLEYHPDLVLLQVFLNDPDFPPRTKYYHDRMRGWAHLRASSIFDYWYSGKFVAERLYNRASRKELVNYYHHLFLDQDHWQYFTSGMKSFKRLCKRHNIPFAAFLFPTFSFPLDAESYPLSDIHARISHFAGNHNIPFLDLLPAYKGIPNFRLQAVLDSDGHPNEIAHRIAADHLHSFLGESGLLASVGSDGS